MGTKSAASTLAAADPVLAAIIARVGPMTLAKRRRGRPRTDAYGALLRAIVGQQLSTKAAATIFGRITDLFGGEVPRADQLLEVDTEALRAAGLSGRKVEYVRDLARHVVDRTLDVDRLDELGDEAVIAELTAVRGLGIWTAHMFLIFQLERADVLPVGDLGIRSAARAAYGLGELPTAAELERIAEPWRPHRSLASIYLWESLDNAPA